MHIECRLLPLGRLSYGPHMLRQHHLRFAVGVHHLRFAAGVHHLRFAAVVATLLWLLHPNTSHAQLSEADSRAPSETLATARYAVASLEANTPQQVRAMLTSAGYRELAMLQGRRLLLERVASAATATVVEASDVLPLEPYSRNARISSELLDRSTSDIAVPVLIHMMPQSTGASVRQWLERAGLPMLGSGTAGETFRLSTRLPPERLQALTAELSALDDVFFVERVHHLGLFNDRSAGTIQSGMQGASAAATPIWEKGLHGEGQIVGILDTGVDADSCWYSSPDEALPKTNTWSETEGYGAEVDDSHSKIVAYDFLYSCDQFASARGCDDPSQAQAWDSNGHGTHCSGSMVGNRASGGENGMAPAAKLVVQDAGYQTNDCADLPGIGCPVVDLYPLFQQAYDQGARIHNNSYGDNENAPTPEPSNYTARSQDVDRFTWDHKDMLLVFAAGNSGTGNAEFSVCSPSTNKNGLSVGSARTTPTSNSDDDLSSFSSRGWTADGRIKPDLIAPGCNTSAGTDRNINSHNCTQNSGCGTSYAAPVMVGAAALVRQYLTEGYYPSGAKNPADALQPTAALLKALLINSAVSMDGRDNAGDSITPIPSNEQGWGRIQLDRSLLFSGAARKLLLDDHELGFPEGDTSSVAYTLSGVDASEPLKVTLTWTDYPGSPDAAPRSPQLANPDSFNASQLVNDLDLEVSDGTTTYLGNAFREGVSEAGGMPDRRNNVEQVLIAAPTTGNWTVHVKATTIAKETQDFALVVTGKWASAGRDAAGAAQDTTNTTGAAGAAGPAIGDTASAGAGAGPMQGAAGTPTTGSSSNAADSSSGERGAAGNAAPGAMNASAAMTAKATGTAGSSGASTMGSRELAQSAQAVASTGLSRGSETEAEQSSGCSVSSSPAPRSPAWLLWLAGAALWRARKLQRRRLARRPQLRSAPQRRPHCDGLRLGLRLNMARGSTAHRGEHPTETHADTL